MAEIRLGKGLLAPPHAPSLIPPATPGQPFMRVGSGQQQQMANMMPNNSLSRPPPSMFSHPPPVGMPPGSDSTDRAKSQAAIGDPGILSRPPLIERGLPQPPGQVRFPTPNLPRPPMNIGPGGKPHPLMGLMPPQAPPNQGPPPLTDFPPPGSQTEVWFEYKTADGRSYYSHPPTQKTTWERPKEAQVITAPPHMPTHASTPRYPFQPPPRLPGISSSLPPQLVPTRVWSEHKTQEGKIYFYNKVTKQSVWERPKDFELVMPLPSEFTPSPSGAATAAGGSGQGGPTPSNQSQPASFQSSPSTQHIPAQARQPSPGAAESTPLAASQTQTDSEVDRSAIQTPPAHTVSIADSTNESEQMETETSSDQNTVDTEEHMKQNKLSEGAAGEVSSTSFTVPTAGQPPFHTQTSLTAPMLPMTHAPANLHMFPIEQSPPIGHMQPPYIRPPLFAMRPSMPPFEPPMGRSFPPPQTMLRGRPPLISMPPPHIPFQGPPSGGVPILSGLVPHQAVQQKHPSEETGQEKPSETESKEELKGPRPMADIPIPGTPWSVVWTTDERQFFFNVASRTSLWTLPEGLKDNPHVTKILEEPPWSRKRVGEVKFLPDSKKLRLLGGSNSDDEESEDGLDELEQRLPTGGSQEGAPVITTEIGSDVMKREQKAVLAKAGKSLEERQSDFKEMLLERGVSAFSTWDKELPKFVFDPRYLFLNTKDRKSCFESFIRSRAEEERKEKKSKLKEKIDQFKSLLVEAKLLSKPTFSFSEFASKYSKDERFKSVDKMKEREQLFTDHLTELKRLSKQKDGSQKQTTKSKAEKAKSDFMDMLGESEAITERSQWKKIKSLFDRDTRYRAVDSTAQKEEWFKEYVSNMSSQTDPEQERQERIQASLKEREREVKISRSAHEKEWGRERDQLRKTETVQDYRALLVDMVRSSDSTWHDVKRSLRQDRRWKMAELLDIDEKESLFREHVSNLEEKKRVRFRKLLEETTQITLVMSWKKARKLIKEDPRYKAFGDTDLKREHEYDKFMRDAMVMTKNDFKSLLKESKLISYKSRDMIEESDKHYRDIVNVLKKDKRYLILECVAEERDQMLSDYIDDLDKRGPPPPPTATHPSERLRKSII